MKIDNNDPMSHKKLLNEEAYSQILKSDLLKIFEAHRNSEVDPYYIDRADRNRFAAAQLKQTPIKSLLNLGGGGRRHLEQSLASPEIKVYEIDIQGDCDLQTNLDQLSALPFEDNTFDAVCAFDVLEHLEKFHLINEEMFRVAKDYILISLPNSACEIFFNPFRNRVQKTPDINRGAYSTFYGLPLAPPDDRHRWWLYFQDIVRFYYYFSLTHDADLEFWTPRLNLKKRVFKALFGTHLYHTFFCQHVWIKLKKRLS